MEFRFSQDELDLRDGAREYLRGACTREALRKLVENESADLGGWSEMIDMGLVGFLLPETQGGLGMSEAAFALLAEEAGYVALPEPLIDVAGVAVPLLAAAGRDAELSGIAEGRTRVLTAHYANPYVNQLAPGDMVLQFTNASVDLVGEGDLDVTPADSIDPLRRLSRVSATNSVALASGNAARLLAVQAFNRAAVFTAAELLGLAQAMIDMSTDYVTERKQFGVAIGTFQAVKHHLATAFTKTEFARPAVYRAAASLSTGDTRIATHAAHAKIAAGDAAINAAEAAIQVHGGIGYTFEADLHLWMKRVWALTGLWGDRNYHMQVLDQAVFKPDFELGPGATFPQPAAP